MGLKESRWKNGRQTGTQTHTKTQRETIKSTFETTLKSHNAYESAAALNSFGTC